MQNMNNSDDFTIFVETLKNSINSILKNSIKLSYKIKIPDFNLSLILSDIIFLVLIKLSYYAYVVFIVISLSTISYILIDILKEISFISPL
jgi:hypothetical protein